MNEEKIIDAWENQTHRGVLDAQTIGVVGSGENPSCGDKVRLDFVVENGIIKKALHSEDGCVLSQAGAELLCEHLEGKTVDKAARMTPAEMLDLFEGRPLPVRLGCCLLPWQAMKTCFTK